MRDPYEVLGVSREATEQEVTTAYRKLAKKYHPDVNPNDADAQKKMADINVAYDEIKSGRAKYEDYSKPQGAPRSAPGGYYGQGGFYGFNPFEAFGFDTQRARQAERAKQDGFDPVRRYVNAMRYNEALYALSTIQTHSAEWYYLSAVANYGLGNRVTALNQISEAIAMAPNNPVYRDTLRQMQGTYQQYTQRSRGFGMPNLSSLNTLCLGICLFRVCCGCTI